MDVFEDYIFQVNNVKKKRSNLTIIIRTVSALLLQMEAELRGCVKDQYKIKEFFELQVMKRYSSSASE